MDVVIITYFYPKWEVSDETRQEKVFGTEHKFCKQKQPSYIHIYIISLILTTVHMSCIYMSWASHNISIRFSCGWNALVSESIMTWLESVKVKSKDLFIFCKSLQELKRTYIVLRSLISIHIFFQITERIGIRCKPNIYGHIPSWHFRCGTTVKTALLCFALGHDASPGM